ncbi:MAG: hypothetical protein QOD75_2958 [Blastocatellia bacterium]|jgi:hypothetical protein|nr:hypothetical protein [Blastocatellia bacterium]
MHRPCAAIINRTFRLTGTFLLVAGLLATSGCFILDRFTKKEIAVPALLSPLTEANATQLIAEVNRQARVQSLRGKVDLEFQDTSFATSGIAEKYRAADGTVVLQRPGKIFLIIQAPFISADIARMTSDGEHFRVAVLKGDAKYQRFILGTNNAIYRKLSAEAPVDKSGATKKKTNLEENTVNALSNLRPQHLTEALLISGIEHRPGLVYAQSEFYEEENDTRPQSNNKRVMRGYYFLDELETKEEGTARLLRRFWFDRVGGLRLARLQTFDANGALNTDVTYRNLKSFGADASVQLPAVIELTRPQDHYKLSLTYQAPESAVLDHEYPADTFLLENKWQLPEYDLDKEKGATSK